MLDVSRAIQCLDFTDGSPHIEGAWGGFHWCPVHAPRILFPQGLRTMRIFSTPEGELLFRCTFCGWCLNVIELYGNVGQSQCSPEAGLEAVRRYGILDKDLSPDQKTLLDVAWRLRCLIPFGRELYRDGVETGTFYPSFGDWIFARDIEVASLTRGTSLPKGTLRERHLIRIGRDVFGAVAGFTIYSLPSRMPLFNVELRPQAGALLDVPPWADYYDWSRGIIVAVDPRMANALERAICEWEPEKRIPVACVSRWSGELPSNHPLERVWVCVRGESGDLGLRFYQGDTTDIRVIRFGTMDDQEITRVAQDREAFLRSAKRSVMDGVVHSIISRGSSGGLGAALGEVIGKPHVPAPARNEVVRRVAVETGLTIPQLTRMLPPDHDFLTLRLSGGEYRCQASAIVRQTRKGSVSISNFAVRPVAVHTSAREPAPGAVYELELQVGEETTSLRIGQGTLDHPLRLWRALEKAAAAAGLPALSCPNNKERKQLPELVKAMLPLARKVRHVAHLGFEAGSFHAPHYTVSPRGVFACENLCCVGDAPDWFRPEPELLSPAAFPGVLQEKARGLWLWMAGEDRTQREQAAELLAVALRFLFEASRSLQTYLSVPSMAFLENLSGILQIGCLPAGTRGEEPLDVPKLLRSQLSRKSQFAAHGRFVIAVAPEDRRLEAGVLKAPDPGPMMRIDPPARGVLSLLTYAVLVSASPEEAGRTIAALARKAGCQTGSGLELLNSALARLQWTQPRAESGQEPEECNVVTGQATDTEVTGVPFAFAADPSACPQPLSPRTSRVPFHSITL